MGSGGGNYDLHEVIRKSSSRQMKEHGEHIKKFVERGYVIEDQQKSEETGLHGELLNTTLITTLKPNTNALPKIKFEAREIFGTYDFDKGVFRKWEESKFELKSYKKSADVRDFNSPWQPFEVE